MYVLSKLALCAAALFQSILVGCAPTPVEHARTSEIDRRATTITTVDQRLFKIDGKTQYFAGPALCHIILEALLNRQRHEFLVARPSLFKRRC